MDVQHNKSHSRFELHTPEGLAVLEYEYPSASGGTTVDFTRTYVPVGARGRGVAEALVRAGLAWARAESLGITASCWYVAKFIRR